ncbi:MAG: hypothetical protein WCF85_06430 [Rhodospirillaceae bacterium]
MLSLRIPVFALLVVLAAPIDPACAQAPVAKQVQATAGSFDDEALSGPGGLYRIGATSAGVLAGAGLMSWFIDGWVIEAFTGSGGLSSADAFELVHELDSHVGFEAAAVVLSGLAGGLIADSLYRQGVIFWPGLVESVDHTLKPPLAAVTGAWSAVTGWTRDRIGDSRDWVQARSREGWDRWQQWLDRNSPARRTP